MKAFRLFVFFILCSSLLPAYGQKPQWGTRTEAINMVKQVQRMFASQGPSKTFKAVTSQLPVFKDRDLYPFIYTLEGVNVAHGVKRVLVGKDLLELRDGEGTPLIKLMVNVAKTRKNGWVDYKWPNPVTRQLTSKSAYIERLGRDYFVGVGVYIGQ